MWTFETIFRKPTFLRVFKEDDHRPDIRRHRDESGKTGLIRYDLTAPQIALNARQ
jgi:hypothetical protein